MLLMIFLFEKKRRRRRGKEKIFESHVRLVSRLMGPIWVVLGSRSIFRIEEYVALLLRLGGIDGLLVRCI